MAEHTLLFLALILTGNSHCSLLRCSYTNCLSGGFANRFIVLSVVGWFAVVVLLVRDLSPKY